MSSMLQKSVLDAKMLQEAALEEAKKYFAEKYRRQLSESIDKMLESDPPGDMTDPLSDLEDMSADMPSGDESLEDPSALETDPLSAGEAPVGDGEFPLPKSHENASGEDESVELDLEMLAEMIRKELSDLEESEQEQIDETMSSGAVSGPGGSDLSEEVEVLEEAEESEDEDDCKECGCPLNEKCDHYSELKEEVETLAEMFNSSESARKKVMSALNEAKIALKAQLLENTKLIYQNKTLLDESLSEPQRRSLVESISRADSVEKAKTIYEMRSVAGRQKPKSLHENLLSGRSNVSVLQEAKKREPEVDPTFEKMRFLAGIGKKN